MKLRTLSASLAIIGLLAVAPGCKDFYDVNVDPLHPSTATEGQLLPGTQVAMATYLGFSLEGLGQATSTLVGQLNSSRGVGTFQQSGASFGNQWGGLYNDMLENNELIIQKATADGNKNFLGVAQLQKAYTFSIMVDMWGSIPYSQALQGISNRAPYFDNDQDIYMGNAGKGIQGLFSLIDDGLANVSTTAGAAVGGTDLIYAGDMTKWANFGRTLKLKLYNQIRGVAATKLNVDIRALVAPLLSSQLISSGGDFELGYGNSIQPENRNINFLSNFVQPGREDFINQDFYQYMVDRTDPRINFYFYNQRPTSDLTNVIDFAPTITYAPFRTTYDSGTGGGTSTGFYSTINRGFGTVRLGSSSSLASAASADYITLPGLYPAGGRYNDDTPGPADFSYGRGVVAQRFLTKFARHFIEAELQLMVMNDNAAARAAFESGVREAFLKVEAIGQADGSPTSVAKNSSPKAIPSLFAPISVAAVVDPTTGMTTTPAYTVPSPAETYIKAALTRFDAATDNAKLNIIMQEKYVASFGMGEDVYTDLRRTGLPTSTTVGTNTYGVLARVPGDVPGTVSSGGFPTILYYSVSDLTLNPNALPQHHAGDRPFWIP